MKQTLEEILRTMHTMPAAEPRESFRANARIRILNTIDSHPVTHIGPHVFDIPYHIARWAGGLALASTLIGGSMVYAAQYSKPGSPLYPVKTASEQAALRLAPTKKIKTSVATTVIDRRAQEVSEVKASGSKEEVIRAVTEYHETVRELEHEPRIDVTEVQTHVREHEDEIDHETRRGDDD